MTVIQLIKILESDGWRLKNQKGSHAQYIHPSKSGKITVPIHKGDIPIGTAKAILKAAKLEDAKWKN